jgi:glycine oxidase
MSSSLSSPASARPDVIVVGAGVIGLSAAWALLEQGRTVTVVERGAVGPGGASWAGGGILAPLDPADIDPALLPWLAESLSGYAAWCEALREASGIDPEYTVSGLQVLPPADDAGWRRLAAALDFGCTTTANGLLLPRVAQVRSPRLLAALAAAVRARGGRIVEGEAVERLIGDRRVEGVETRRQRIASARVVLAAGAWSNAVWPQSRIAPVKGEMLLFAAVPGRVRHIVLQDHQYLIPRRDGAIVAGSTLEPGQTDARPTAAGRAAILAAVARMDPALAREPVVAHWAALRPAPVGALPHVEAVAACQGLFLATGHYRLGLTLAPGSARRIASLVNSG